MGTLSVEQCSWLAREEHPGVTIYRHPSAPFWVEVDEENGVVTLSYSEDELEDYIYELIDSGEDARSVVEEALSELESCARHLAMQKGYVLESIARTMNDILDRVEELEEE